MHAFACVRSLRLRQKKPVLGMQRETQKNTKLFAVLEKLSLNRRGERVAMLREERSSPAYR